MSASSRLVLGVVVLAAIVVVIAVAVAPPPSPSGTSGAGGLAGATAGIGTSAAPSSAPSAAPAADTATAPTTAAHATAKALAQASARPTTRPTANPATCSPTDQDRYVYHPYRLAIHAACISITGTVAAVRHEVDGDVHILVALDPAYRYLLTTANQGVELGDLVVEPVCVRRVTQADAIATCASDPDPLAGLLPTVGARVWMEGRYVFDLDHGGWAELHPLYRWSLR
ncbi:MAG: hypothetical protein IVW53_13865 [Chloroflexi bacterium]|nr:hypothetical protein [Chloroflexota bacterium]